MSLGKMVFFVKLWSLTEAVGYLPIRKMNLSPACELSVNKEMGAGYEGKGDELKVSKNKLQD